MKTSGSDWDLEELLLPVVDSDGRSPSPAELEELLLPRRPSNNRTPGVCGGVEADGDDGGISFDDVCAFGFIGDRDGCIGNHAAGGQLTGSQIWTQSHNLNTPRHSSISATMESQSSLCTGSPTSSLKPKGVENQGPGCTSGSEQSDDESIEIEGGSCDQSTRIPDLKRMRRMVSNRESARRSRKRKQAHLVDLELQVDQLRGENSSLYKQLTDANHEFTEAVTDNRVLKSDVETLRVKVKMAEDLVTRGSLTCSLDHLLQSQITTPNILNARNLCRASEVPPIIDLQANGSCYIGASATGQAPNTGIERGGAKDGNTRMRLNQSSPGQSIPSLDNLQSCLSSEITSSGSDLWAWDSHANIMPKQF